MSGANSLPANFASTANALEGLAFVFGGPIGSLFRPPPEIVPVANNDAVQCNGRSALARRR